MSNRVRVRDVVGSPLAGPLPYSAPESATVGVESWGVLAKSLLFSGNRKSVARYPCLVSGHQVHRTMGDAHFLNSCRRVVGSIFRFLDQACAPDLDNQTGNRYSCQKCGKWKAVQNSIPGKGDRHNGFNGSSSYEPPPALWWGWGDLKKFSHAPPHAPPRFQWGFGSLAFPHSCHRRSDRHDSPDILRRRVYFELDHLRGFLHLENQQLSWKLLLKTPGVYTRHNAALVENFHGGDSY